jgi:hypothetical protein
MKERSSRIFTVTGYAFCGIVAALLLLTAFRPTGQHLPVSAGRAEELARITDTGSQTLEIENVLPDPEVEKKVEPPKLLSQIHPEWFKSNQPPHVVYPASAEILVEIIPPPAGPPPPGNPGCGCKLKPPPPADAEKTEPANPSIPFPVTQPSPNP